MVAYGPRIFRGRGTPMMGGPMGPIPGPMGPPFGKYFVFLFPSKTNIRMNRIVQAFVVAVDFEVEAVDVAVAVVDSSEELVKTIVVIQMMM